MGSIEKLGLATQEQTALIDLLDRHHGVIVLVGPNRDARLATLRTLQLHLEAHRRDIAPLSQSKLMVEHLTATATAEIGQRVSATPSWTTTAVSGHGTPVVLIPDLEDPLMLELACNHGQQGTLVLVTMPEVDGAHLLMECADDGVDREALANGLLAVITQHTVPKACPLCRIDLAPSFALEESFEQTFGALGFPFPGFQLREGRGCHTCDFTGTFGTIQVYEFLYLSRAVKDQVIEDPRLELIDTRAMEEGMLSWESKLYFRLKRGDVSLKAAMDVLRLSQGR
ncbi:MAG: hypothetical protein ABI743_03860 [bacterium]